MAPSKPAVQKIAPLWLALIVLALVLPGCVRRTPGTAAPQQTASRIPTETSGLEPSVTSLPIPTTLTPATVSIQPAPVSTEPGPSPTPDLAVYNRQAWSDDSPFGPWRAVFLAAYPEGEDGNLIGNQYYVRVSLIQLETSETSILIDEWRPYGLGFTIPQALLWSNDGRYLFLAETGNADGSGERFYDQLERVRLESGELEALDLPGGPSESISPDGQQLARIDGDKLALIKIDSGQVRSIQFDMPRVEWRPGQIFWSPQSGFILFNVRLNPFAPLDEMRSNLYLADLQTDQVKTLMAEDRRRFSILSFPLESFAVLADLEAREWWLSLPDGTVRPDPPQDIIQANQAIQSYFTALQSGYYKEASMWFGGSYETLQANNTDVDPDDRAALFERACTINGYQCLKVNSLLIKQITGNGEYLFEVSFTDADGNLFIRNPCCGGEIETQPPEWLFQYSVRRDANGRYKVMELPVYVP